MPVAHLESIDLYYATHGRFAEGPAIVLLHGLGSSADDWALQVPALSARYRLIAPDLRGHGRSPAQSLRITVEQMADDVAGMLAALAEPSAHVVGLSLGGCVAQALAVRYPERVRSLVLVNTFARLEPAGVRGVARLLGRLGLLAVAPMPALAAYVAGGLFPKAEQRPLYDVAVARLGRNPRRPYLALVAAIGRFDLRRELAAVRCPTLILAGDRDATVPRSAVLALHHAIPGSTLRFITDSGHATPIDQPEAFNAAVMEFLEKEEVRRQMSDVSRSNINPTSDL